MLPTRTKQPAETRLLVFDFRRKLSPGATLTGVPTLTIPPGLTVVGSPSVEATRVLCLLAGGTLGEQYLVSCVIAASDGQVLELDALIRVQDSD